MKDFVLLIVVLAAFIYGYFLMGKLDKWLEENQSQKLISGSKIRIGFETPAIIDSIAGLLEQFSSEYPDYELNLFYGSARMEKKKKRWYNFYILFLYREVTVWAKEDKIRNSC